jgi:putative phosphoesterase
LAAADLILHAGDLVTVELLDELRRLAPVEAVYGNMDDGQLRAVLPERRVVEAGGARVGMVHVPGPSAGRAARLVAAFPDCDAVVYGHTHVPEVRRNGDVWILNPGSPTERRRASARAFLLLDVDDGEVRPRLVELP